MDIDIYYHCHCGPSWARHFTNFYNRLKRSGLYDTAARIHICCDGDFDYKDDKFFVSWRKKPFSDEMPTLEMIRNNAEHRDGYVLFVQDTGNEDQNEYIHHFLMDDYAGCIGDLEVFKAVSVDFNINDAGYGYYDGNCWWSKYSHIRKLDMDISRPRLWLLSKDGEPAACLHHTGLESGDRRFDTALYRSNP